MKKLTVGDIREPIIQLALVMEEKLRDHDEDRGPRGWINDEPLSLFLRIYDELDELRPLLVDLPMIRGDDFEAIVDKVIRECADIANFPMMIMDIVGGWKHGNQTR